MTLLVEDHAAGRVALARLQADATAIGRTSASSPATRTDGSLLMTRAATVFRTKLAEPTSGDFQTELNLGAADTTVTAITVAATVRQWRS